MNKPLNYFKTKSSQEVAFVAKNSIYFPASYGIIFIKICGGLFFLLIFKNIIFFFHFYELWLFDRKNCNLNIFGYESESRLPEILILPKNIYIYQNSKFSKFSKFSIVFLNSKVSNFRFSKYSGFSKSSNS